MSDKLPAWRDMERDTADWATKLQFDWRRRAPAWQKLEAVNQLYQTVRMLAYSGLRDRFPQASTAELNRRLADKWLGADLAVQVYPSHPGGQPLMMTSPISVTLLVLRVFEALGVRYFIDGSVASAMYGVERMTMHTDVVADLQHEHIAPLTERLSHDFYLDAPSILEAIVRRSSFNLIHQGTMFKVDVFIPQDRPFDQVQFARRVERVIAFEPETRAYVASVEDTILAKLEWYRMGGEVSERQWRDVLGVMQTQAERLDKDYLRQWANELKVTDLLDLALQSISD